jgi:hypothetical protein
MVLEPRVAETRGEVRMERRSEKSFCWTRRSQGSWRKFGLMSGFEGLEDDYNETH